MSRETCKGIRFSPFKADHCPGCPDVHGGQLTDEQILEIGGDRLSKEQIAYWTRKSMRHMGHAGQWPVGPDGTCWCYFVRAVLAALRQSGADVHGGERKVAWLIERFIGDQPQWLRWHDYDERVWVTDANLADHYPSRIPAARDARHLTKMGEPCEATEHIFFDKADLHGGARADRLTPEERLSVEHLRGVLKKHQEPYLTSIGRLLVIIADLLAPRPDSGARA